MSLTSVSFQTLLILIVDSIDVLINYLMNVVWFSLSFVKYHKIPTPFAVVFCFLSKPAGAWHFTFVFDS